MPNGSDYSPEEFRRAQRELEPLDPLLKEFSQLVGGSIRTSYHGEPNRRIHWGTDVVRGFHIHPTNREKRLFGVTVVAHSDQLEPGFGQPRIKRRIKSENIERDLTGNELLTLLPRVLERARAIVESWTVGDLK